MDIKELRKERTKMEGELAVKIAEIVIGFRRRTGVSVEGISVEMLEITDLGDGQREYVSGNVSCRIAF